MSCGRAGQRIVNLDTLELEAIRPTSMVNDFSDTVIEAFGGVQITRQFNVQVISKCTDFTSKLALTTHAILMKCHVYFTAERCHESSRFRVFFERLYSCG